MYSQNDGKYSQADKCVKSIIMTNVVDCILSIDTFEKKCVVFKVMLQSLRIKDHVKTIGIDQSLSNIALFEHRCHQNINKLYKHDGECDYQKKFKYILEAAMVSTPEVFTDDSPLSPMTPTPFKKPSARK